MLKKLGRFFALSIVLALLLMLLPGTIMASGVSEAEANEVTFVSGEVIAEKAAESEGLTLNMGGSTIFLPDGTMTFINEQTKGVGSMDFLITTTDKVLGEEIMLRDEIVEQLSSVYNVKMVITLPDGTSDIIMELPDPITIKLVLTIEENEAMKAEETVMCRITTTGELEGLWSGSMFDETVTISSKYLGEFVLVGQIEEKNTGWITWVIVGISVLLLGAITGIIIKKRNK